eukprot:9971092-Ditylum_brightwellii.AAC.1
MEFESIGQEGDNKDLPGNLEHVSATVGTTDGATVGATDGEAANEPDKSSNLEENEMEVQLGKDIKGK